MANTFVVRCEQQGVSWWVVIVQDRLTLSNPDAHVSTHRIETRVGPMTEATARHNALRITAALAAKHG